MESFENYFLQIYEKHKKFVYTVIRFHTKDSRSSDDVFQEAWLEIYRGLEKFKGDSKISTWIYSVVRNRTLNFLKRENRAAKAENEAGREIVRTGTAELSRSDIADSLEGLVAGKVIVSTKAVEAELIYKNDSSFEIRPDIAGEITNTGLRIKNGQIWVNFKKTGQKYILTLQREIFAVVVPPRRETEFSALFQGRGRSRVRILT